MGQHRTPADYSEQLAWRLLDSLNAHDPGQLRDILHDGCVVVSPAGSLGAGDWRLRLVELFTEYPDASWSGAQVFGAGESFVARASWTATRIRPPRRSVQVPIRFSGRVTDGKIGTIHIEYDATSIGEQLGIEHGDILGGNGYATPPRWPSRGT